ncbi:hypothetical protein [Helicobacter labetoulli]
MAGIVRIYRGLIMLFGDNLCFTMFGLMVFILYVAAMCVYFKIFDCLNFEKIMLFVTKLKNPLLYVSRHRAQTTRLQFLI